MTIDGWLTADETAQRLGVSYSRAVRALRAYHRARATRPQWLKKMLGRFYLVHPDGLPELAARLKTED